MQRKYKLIIFDLDGTLIDSLPLHMLAFDDLLREHGIKVDRKYLRRSLGTTTLDIFRQLKRKYKFSDKIQDLREERRYHYFKLLGSKDIVFPGVRESLKKIKRNYRIALATGSSKVVFTHSTDIKFQNLFDVVVTINDVKYGKPSPLQFQLAAKKMKVKPSECLVIGDSIFDAIASERAGMDFVGVTTGYNTKKTLSKYCVMGTASSVTDLERRLP